MHQFRFGETCQRHEPDSAGVGTYEAGRHLECEADLAGASRTRQGQEARRGEGAPDLFELTVPADEAGPRGRLCRGDTGASLDAGEGGAASSGGNLPEEISSHESVAGDQEYAFLRVRGDGRDGAVVAEVEKRALETLLHPRGAEHPA